MRGLLDRLMSRLFARTGAVCVLLGAAACHPSPAPGPVPASAPRVQLVDSTVWESEEDGWTLWRLEVRHGPRVDTIPGVLTDVLPILVGGSRLLGFHYHGDSFGAFEYDLGTRALRRDWLPDDLHPAFSAAAFAPDGRHIAYVVVPGDGTGYAVARTWPGREVVWRGATVEVPATDAAGGNQVRWLSPDTAEVVIETGASTDSAWHHVLGSIQRRTIVSAETLREKPRW